MRVTRKLIILVLVLASIGTLPAFADVVSMREIVFGNGTPGPYSLSWQNILLGTDSVSVNSLAQTRGLDYTVDSGGGTVTFTHSLDPKSTAVVAYQYDTNFSTRQKNVTIPLQLDLSRTQTKSLYLSALCQSGSLSQAQQPSNSLTVGIGAGLQMGRSQWNAQVSTTPANEGPASHDASVSVDDTPARAAKLHADVATHDAAGTGGDTQAVNLAATIGINKPVSVTAQAAQNQMGTTDSASQSLQLAFVPNKIVKMNAGVAVQQSDSTATRIVSVNGTVRPTNLVELAAGYKNHTVAAGSDGYQHTLDTSTASIAWGNARRLKVTGTYGRNVEDNGLPQPLERRGVGLETSAGALSVTGGYDWSDYYSTDTAGKTMRVGLGLRLSSGTQLTGGYQQCVDNFSLAPEGLTSYTFGLVHNAGSRLSMSLNGSVDQPAGASAVQTTEYKATANLGVKF